MLSHHDELLLIGDCLLEDVDLRKGSGFVAADIETPQEGLVCVDQIKLFRVLRKPVANVRPDIESDSSRIFGGLRICRECFGLILIDSIFLGGLIESFRLE